MRPEGREVINKTQAIGHVRVHAEMCTKGHGSMGQVECSHFPRWLRDLHLHQVPVMHAAAREPP